MINEQAEALSPAIRREEGRGGLPNVPGRRRTSFGRQATDCGSISIVMVTPCVVHHANTRPLRLFQKLAPPSPFCFNRAKLL